MQPMAEKKQQPPQKPQISMAASIVALRGVKIFLNAGKGAAERQASPPRPRPTRRAAGKGVIPANKLQLSVVETLLRNTRFNK